MYCSPGKEKKKKYCLFSRWLLQLIFKILQVVKELRHYQKHLFKDLFAVHKPSTTQNHCLQETYKVFSFLNGTVCF